MWRPPPIIRSAVASGLGVVMHKRKLRQIGFHSTTSDVDELHGVLSGRLEIFTHGQWRPAQPQSFAYFARRGVYGIRQPPDAVGPIEIINVLFRAPKDWKPDLPQPHLHLPDVWWRKFLDLEADARYDGAAQRVIPREALMEFVEALARSRVARGAAQDRSPRRPDVQVEWMETWAAAEDVIRRRAGEGLSAADLARAVDVSPTQLRRIYHAVQGLSPKAALTAFRIEQARKLLISGDLSVTQVAERVGYETIQRFSAAFRAVTGKTPTTFARGG